MQKLPEDSKVPDGSSPYLHMTTRSKSLAPTQASRMQTWAIEILAFSPWGGLSQQSASVSFPISCEKDNSSLYSLSLPVFLAHFLRLFIFLTQIAVTAHRMCRIRLLCNSNLLFRLPLCTKEKNMYWLNGLVMDVSNCEWKSGSPLQHKQTLPN